MLGECTVKTGILPMIQIFIRIFDAKRAFDPLTVARNIFCDCSRSCSEYRMIFPHHIDIV